MGVPSRVNAGRLCVRNNARCIHDGRPIFLVNVEDVGRVFLWDDKRMSGIDGIDVEERERSFIFIHDLSRKFPRGYPAE